MNTQTQEALKLALEALKTYHYAMIDAGVLDRQEVLNQGFTAATAVKEALAEQPAQQKPTCKQNLQVWVISNGKGRGQFSWEPQDERYWTRMEPAQQQSAERVEPLTDEQRRETINRAWNEYLRGEGHDSFGWYLSQATEAAHGIKGDE